MRVTVFASGSTGNCTLVQAGGERLLIDAGISLRRLTGFLAAEGLRPGDLSAVLITHEHGDHVSGLDMLTRKHGLRILAPRTVGGEAPRRAACDGRLHRDDTRGRELHDRRGGGLRVPHAARY